MLHLSVLRNNLRSGTRRLGAWYAPWQRSLHVGENVNGWKIKKMAQILEFDMTASILEHASGGQLLHVQRADPNATFSVGFRTVPRDSTGLPHILEHTVLCGSERYPCRDPFFNMLNRSLATFMNAMTAPDHTFYPFSSQNAQDCRNLQSVYLDAVFRPRLCQADFRQEGWRLEHENPEDSSTPITLKGVVYNEMKGVFSDNQNLYGTALLNGILPSHTYGVCSGGLTSEIPKLRHGDLVRFHQRHYTPGNARFFMYGDRPLSEHLKAIESYLQPSGSSAPPVPPEPRWTEPRRKHIACRGDPMAANPEKQGTVSTSLLCCDIQDVQEVFTMQVVAELLVKGPNAAFYRTLIEPGLGAGLSPSTGYESETKDTFFSVGLQGVAPADFPKVEETIEQTLRDVLKEGFPEERVEAVLHGIEISVKHQSANFGLSILFAISSLWNHDGDILTALGIEKKVAQLRADLKADPGYLQKKVEQYLVNNPHRLILTMAPDPDFELKQKRVEESLLHDKLASLTDEDRKRIYVEGLELIESRKKDNKEVLPTLRVSDIPQKANKVESEERNVSSVPVSFFQQPTNGVTYFRALLATDKVDEKLQPYLPVFAHVAAKMGTKRRSFKELDQVVSLHTGGLGVSCHVTEGLLSPGYEGSLALVSHCLDRNISHMFDLWGEVLEEGDLEDEARFGTLIKALAADMVNSVAAAGHHYAMLGASALVSDAQALNEAQSGMALLALLKDLAGGASTEGLSRVREVRSALASVPLRCSVNALPGADLRPLDDLLARLKHPGRGCILRADANKNKSSRGRLHVLPFDVSYVAQATPTVPYAHPDFAPLRILARLLTSKYLHPEVREKGGAYGGGASLSISGLFRYYSYRDPTPLNSLRVFDGASKWLKDNVPSSSDLEEAKLGVFQAVDAPIAPGQRGSLRFLYGITDELLEDHRKRLMGVTAEELLCVADKYLSLPFGRCVLGPHNADIIQDGQCSWTTIEA